MGLTYSLLGSVHGVFLRCRFYHPTAVGLGRALVPRESLPEQARPAIYSDLVVSDGGYACIFN